MAAQDNLVDIESLKEENYTLKNIISQKDDIIKQHLDKIKFLRSELDKYQSVLHNIHNTPMKPRKTRLMGISAEPESTLTYEELMKTKFTNYPKNDKYVFILLKKFIQNALKVADFFSFSFQNQIEDLLLYQ